MTPLRSFAAFMLALVMTVAAAACSRDDPLGEAASANDLRLAPPTSTLPLPEFEFTVLPVDEGVVARMGETWRPGCPVPLEHLRLMTVSHWGFDGKVHKGETVVHGDHAASLEPVFRRMFETRFPIETLRVTNGVDAPPNESTAFNCRKKVGNGAEWSEHSYGTAIDINPVQNPYVSRDGSNVIPPAGATFTDRSLQAPGMLREGDPVVTAFDAAGWKWGGRWTTSRDYMHFSISGG